ncbi:MAG: YicC family protein [Candidatus Aegiribacteria sp.]|nr:YicC family protein [Candidatus Aegiribacteria sp.]MBD3294036.1 YicC family protein [Candidatus Fermentibacteria bacterium]
MLKSMTGFGRAEGRGDDFSLSVEARSVNHRNLSVTMKLPDTLSHLEPLVRKKVKGLFKRGRIGIYTRISLTENSSSSISINLTTVSEYVSAARYISEEYGIPQELSAMDLLRLPGVAEKNDRSETDRPELDEVFRNTLQEALQQLLKARSEEGDMLRPFFRKGFRQIEETLVPVMERQKESAQFRYEKLLQRVREIVGDTELDETRMIQELALISEKSDVTEEVQRLICHLEHAGETMDYEDIAVGRRLEFIVQEMHRELNTMGSKVSDGDLSEMIIEMKDVLASIREQAANIE